MKAKLILITLSVFMAGIALSNMLAPEEVIGTWLTQNKDGKIEVYKKGDKYCGKLVWLGKPIDEKTGKPKLDRHNPDPKLRTRPLNGLELMYGFEYVGNNEWENGKIYDSSSGKTYSCSMKLNKKGELEVRGYFGISLLGRTETWTKVK